jgi:predicted RND superfamily exporter protein
VCFVVYLDFRSLRYTLLALVPLALGMLQMFGVMGLMNVPLNAANMIVLPLILGIGVDNGVHVVHDFCRQKKGLYRVTDSTANAVFINSLGNMVGFGSLMIASHKGLQSLGLVLSLGMACVLLSALAMPSLLMLLNRRCTDDCVDGETTDPTVPFPSLRGLAELSPAFRRKAA